MSYCDIIIPVKDNLADFKPCLESVLRHTDHPYRIIIVNDKSDENTTRYMERAASEHKNITVLANDVNQGFLKSANKGMAVSSAPYMLILNTDTIVTPGWLAKMIRCAESDPKIGIVNPISNKAQNLSIDIPPGENIFSFAEKLDDISRRTYPDIVTAVGFCFMITRQAFDRLGLFDEIYGFGYYEESDYCMRAIKNGFRVAACDDAFVYHRDKTTFVRRDAKNLKLIHKNMRIFFGRWKKPYFMSLKKFNRTNPFLYIRKYFYELERSWVIKRLRYYFNKFRYLADERGLGYAIYRTFNFMNRMRRKEIVYFYPFELSKRYLWTRKNNKPKTVFVFEEISLCGGVIFLLELINHMILDGMDVKIMCLNRTKITEDMRLYTHPILYNDRKELRGGLVDCDFIVATYWTTAYYVSEIIKNNPRATPLYFIQDYESWFYPENERKTAGRIVDTYGLIKNKVTYSDWLRHRISAHDNNITKIRPGINLDVFYPRNTALKRAGRILGMARPSTPRRGFDNMIKALRIVKQKCPDMEISLFGPDNLKKYGIPFEYRDHGALKEDALAELYSSCGIFIEASLFHGLGLTGMEAMACGAACVLTDSGGPREYAVNNENSVLVPPGNPEQMAAEIISLINNPSKMAMLARNGLKTMKNYSIKNTADEFENILKGIG